jgi:hypothetical protein
MIIYHKHHIIPRHAGGLDIKENLISLSIENHAKAHLKLYKETNNEYDRIAWLALSRQISGAEAIKAANSERNKKLQRKLVANGTHILLGGKIQGISSRKRVKKGTHNLLGPSSNKKMLSEGKHISQITQICSHCGKEGKGGGMKTWHFDRCRQK